MQGDGGWSWSRPPWLSLCLGHRAGYQTQENLEDLGTGVPRPGSHRASGTPPISFQMPRPHFQQTFCLLPFWPLFFPAGGWPRPSLRSAPSRGHGWKLQRGTRLPAEPLLPRVWEDPDPEGPGGHGGRRRGTTGLKVWKGRDVGS